MIDFQHLQVFVRAAEMRSFTKASVTLGLSQPTISRIIKELEAHWEGTLFYRTGRGASLSEFGEIALPRAKALLLGEEETSEELRASNRLPSGTVSLALPPSLVAPLIPSLVGELRREMPGVRLRIYEGFSDQIERWLSSGDAEVAIYSKYSAGHTKGSEILFASDLVLAAPGRGRFSAPRTSFRDLGAFPLVLPPLPNGLRVIVETVAKRLNVSLDVIVDADSILAQKEVCQECNCYMIKSPHTIADERARGVFSTSLIVDPIIQRYVVLLSTKQRPLTRAAREVSKRVTTILKRL